MSRMRTQALIGHIHTSLATTLATAENLKFVQNFLFTHSSPETRVFFLVALARVNASHWFNE